MTLRDRETGQHDDGAPPAPPRATLRVLGALDIDGAAGTDPDALRRQPKRAALLAFLVVDAGGDFCHRDRLTAHFWPGGDKRRARGALRQGLRFIRSSLGADVIENRGHHQVRVRKGAVACDALRFEQLMARGRAGPAMDLYRGPFLEGLSSAGGPAFDAWVAERRAHFCLRATEAAWMLAEDFARRDRPADAAYWAKRSLAFGSFDEGRVRRLIEFLDRVGDHSGALRAYRGLRARLQRDYHARPSRLTEELAAAVRERAAAAARTGAAARPDRRRIADRRRKDRRVRDVARPGPDRRKGDRRIADRRSGEDRRDEP